MQAPATLGKRVVASLIAEYLQKGNLAYCLSVFTPESGFGGQFLSAEELSGILRCEVGEKMSVLEWIIRDLISLKPREVKSYNAATQTMTGDQIQNLEQKLTQVD